MDKRLLDASREWFRDRDRFYNEMLAYRVENCLHTHETTRLIVSHKNADTAADIDRLVDDIEKRWTRFMATIGQRKDWPTQVTLIERRHDQSKGLQAADYVAWAVFRAFERGDMRPFDVLRPVLSDVFDISRTRHHTKRRPMG